MLNPRAWLAEAIATFALVFFGPLSVTMAAAIFGATLTIEGIIMISIGHGAAIGIMIYAFGHISGAHFNPAVPIAFLIHGDINKKEALYYIMIQIMAGIAASATLLCLFGNVATLGATLPSGSWSQSFLLEFILTFFLMMVIFGSAVHGKAVKSFAAIAIGATVGLEAMFAGPICGASMNPARSIGPALVSGTTQHLWVYIVATILGAGCAALIYKILHEK